jgi:hypothetical protein
VVVDGHLMVSQEEMTGGGDAKVSRETRWGAPSDTTRWSPGVELNVPTCEIFLAQDANIFCSSPRMVQLNFFERSH